MKTLLLLILVVAAYAGEDLLPGPPDRSSCPRPTPKVPKCRYFTPKQSFGPVASYFNAFIHHDFVCSSSDTEGRLGCGGNFDSSHGGYDVGCKTYAHSSTDSQCKDATCTQVNLVGDFPEALVVGGDLNYPYGQVHSGGVVYGGSLVGNPTVVGGNCGAPRHESPVDFDTEFANLIALSLLVDGLDTTGTTSNTEQIVFTGTNDDDLDVFRISAAQLAAAKKIDFTNVNSRATLIVNVDGVVLKFGGFQVGPNGLEHNLLWNFAHAQSIEMYNLGWPGTILAPLADVVTSSGGVIKGGIIANSFKGKNGYGCFQINWYEFWGCLPDDHPHTPPPGNKCDHPFGPIASDYNTFFLENYYCINSDVEGRVAAGGSLHAQNWAAGCKLFPPANGANCLNMGEKHCSDFPQGTNTNTLVAGINIVLANAEIKVGNVAYGYNYGADNTVSIASDCSATQTTGVIDFGKAHAYLVCLSDTLRQLESTGRYTNEYNQLVLYGSGADTEVFNIGGYFLASAVSLELKNVKQGATVIINVNGVDLPVGGFQFFPQNGFPSDLVVWNFWEATRLRFYQVAWQGAILAPRAVIADSEGQLNGQIFAKSWEQASHCIQVNWVPFRGCLPDCSSNPLPPIVGCADGHREGFTNQAKYPCIAACSTKWDQPGVIGKAPTCQRQAGNDFPNQQAGCSVEDACAPGWHVCASQSEVYNAFQTHSGSCADAGPGFYATQVSGPGCGVCAVDWGTNTQCDGANCVRGCKPNSLTRNDLFGCGSLVNSDGMSVNAVPDGDTCGPFNIFSGNLCGSVPGLSCGSGAGVTEADEATKSAYPGGGVLCCIDQCQDRTQNDNVIG